MSLNLIELPRPHERAEQAGSRAGKSRANEPDVSLPSSAAVDVAPIPPSLAFTERATAALRAYLAQAGLDGYRVFYNYLLDIDMEDVDEHLDKLGEAGAAWEPLAAPGGDDDAGAVASAVHELRFERDRALVHPPGCIRLRAHEVVIARWYWLNTTDDCLTSAWLCAAPSHEHYARLREAVRALRHAPDAVAEWRVVTGDTTGERLPRRRPADATDVDNLLLTDAIRGRVEAEVVRFFDDDAADLFRRLRVPYRRGVLMHGPPGNGKTSLIRHIGARLPNVPGLILRPGARFDADHLAHIVRRWTNQAPAILVIEDLDWLLKLVDVSSFLNLVDGVDSACDAGDGGLLLLATTNHPDRLDPAVNNRPGRFDVVIEVPSPDEAMRFAYLQRRVADDALDDADALLGELAAATTDLAFAHLQEIVRLSGLLAIHAGRTVRTADDLRAAALTVREAYDDAVRGFPARTEMPFGLGYLHRANRRRA